MRRRLQQVDAEEINNMALPWIREHRDEDFFLFVHYWDPHSIYYPPEPYRGLFYRGDETDPENHSLDVLKTQPVWPFTKRHLDAMKEGITDIEYVIAQYDGEIRYTDDNVGELVNLLKELGIYDETVLIFTSDHGESLGEHHFYFDHCDIYEPTIHIPLIVRYPEEVPKGRRIKDLVQSTLCIAPTVLKLFGLDVPKVMEGKNLIEIANGEDEGYGEIYVNQGLWTAKRAIRVGGWKLIKTLDKSFWETPETELYNLEADPEEADNLAEEEPRIVDELELRMYRWLRRKLGRRIDPLERIVENGLPVYRWVRRAAELSGLIEMYDEWRMRVDRGLT